MVGVTLLTTLALIASAQRARVPGPEALGWKLLSLSLLSSVLIQGTRMLGFLGFQLPGMFTEVSIVLPVLGSCIQIGALLVWHLAPHRRFDRVRHGLDGLLFVLATFFILWGVVLGPVFLSERFPMVERLLWLATFLIYDLLLGLAVYLGLPEPSRFLGPLGWLAAAFLIASLHNFKWLLDSLSGTPLFEFPQGPPFIFIIPLAYLGAALSPHPVGSARPPGGQQMRIILLLPYIPVLGATALGIWLLVHGTGSAHRLVLVWLALGLVLLLLVRQYLALRDFATLSQHLEIRVSERTLALENAQVLLLKTERMNSMATLGAGLAHDMNNLLSAIQSRAELMTMDLEEGRPPARQDLMRIQEVTQLAASFSGRLLAMGRQDPEPPQVMDLVKEIQVLLPPLKVLLPRGQSLLVEGIAGSVLFHGSRGTLEQILVNLVSNARDAMPDGGSITLRILAATPEEAALGPSLEVEDTGGGIPEHLQGQLFQPFFTTKPAGKGTGLGLVSVKSLLEKEGGSIRFVSQPGRGTTFQIRLPRAPEPA
jgi:signal transduction histidine kinase